MKTSKVTMKTPTKMKTEIIETAKLTCKSWDATPRQGLVNHFIFLYYSFKLNKFSNAIHLVKFT